jgi:arylsulfatase
MKISDRPNIVLVMADQFRFDCLGRAGHPDLITPNLDALSHRGAYFRSAYSECPICIPARHAILTGRHPQSTGVTGFAMTARIADEENTLPNLLRRAGYQTASVGRSMHTYPHYKRYGFEIVDHHQDNFYREHANLQPLSSSGGAWGDWPHLHSHGLHMNGVSARPWHLDESLHETNSAFARAIRFLDHRDRESPFFLHVGTVAPHPPLLPPACYYQRYDRAGLREPVVADWSRAPDSPLQLPPQSHPPTATFESRFHLHGHQLRSTLAGYYGLINHFDDQLMLLLTRLASADVGRNTYVIFTSDHGEMLGDHDCWRKSLPYEGSAHIPFMLSGPTIASHTVVDEPIALMDILPTCCDIAGVEVPASIDGKSLMPAVRGQSLARPFIHGTHSRMAGLHEGFHYLTNGRQKYVWWLGSGREQLFDLQTDPTELRDLSNDLSRAHTIAGWRERLIEVLTGAPEGFVRAGRLMADVVYNAASSRAVVD